MNFKISPINILHINQISDFANRTWGKAYAQSVLTEWWVCSNHAETMVAFDVIQNRIAGIVVGVKSRWPLIDGTISDTVSICSWYVAPEYAGQGVGRLLVSYFDQTTSSQNTIAITANAVQSFQRLGWIGPFRSQLLILTLPGLRRTQLQVSEFSLNSYMICGDNLPNQLCSELEVIEKNRPANQIRRLRSIEAFRSHLGVWQKRNHHFHIILKEKVPIGFFVLREADQRASFFYRLARLTYVTDIVINKEDEQSLLFLSTIIGSVAPKGTGGIILCSSCPNITKALIVSGWLSEKSPIIGKLLSIKAPLFMLGGFLSYEQLDKIKMTFSDSDVDLNL